jgi:parallel beta-helix repeat protein
MKLSKRHQAQSASKICRASAVEALESRVLLTVFTVTNANDSGAGSLRDALTKSNTTVGVDTISFNISSSSKVIHLTSALPDLWDPGIMDGTTQPGYAGKPLVQIDGSGAGAGVTGMKMWGGSTLKGMSITGFGGGAIDMFNRGFGGNTVSSSWIGVNLSGATAGNNASGVGVWNTANNVIGGPNVSDRNVISASKGALGVLIQGSLATNNLIQNNYIGTDPTGTAARPNATNGIGVQDAPNTKILNNLVSGNANDGIIILNPNATGSIVQGNIVGLNADGTTALPNQWYGIEIQSANNTIGGTTAAQRNIFSGNGQTGVVLFQGGATGNQIQGNYIGTDITGNLDRGNVYQGIAISGANSNSIKGNIISGNNAEGVGVFPGNNNTIQGNTIGLSVAGSALTNSTWAITLINGSSGNVVGGTGAGQANVIYSGHPSGTVFNGGGNTVSTNNIVSSQVTTSNPGSFAFSASAYSAAENAGTVTITVTRTANTNVAASVNYATANGTALSGSDYSATSGTLSFAAGDTSKTFTVALSNDTLVESDETVALTLSSPTAGATLVSPSTATLTIVSDDLPDRTPPKVTSSAFVYDAGPQKLEYTFSEDVSASLSTADIYVIDPISYQSYSPTGVTYDRASNTAVFTFGSVLPKGNYRAYLFSDGVTDAAGNQLDGDNNGSAGGSHVFEFWFLPGDANRDGTVNFADLVAIGQNYGGADKSYHEGDLDGDGVVGFSDLVMVSQNYGESMNGVAAPAAAAPVAAKPVAVSKPAPAAVFSRKPIARNIAL